MCETSPDKVKSYIGKVLETQKGSNGQFVLILQALHIPALLEEISNQFLRAGVVSIFDACKILINKKFVQELTSIYLSVHQDPRTHDEYIETEILNLNLQSFPHVAVAILSKGIFVKFDPISVASTCEQVGVINWAIKLYGNSADAVRLIQHHATTISNLAECFSFVTDQPVALELLLSLVRGGQCPDLTTILSENKNLFPTEQLFDFVEKNTDCHSQAMDSLLAILLDAHPKKTIHFLKANPIIIERYLNFVSKNHFVPRPGLLHLLNNLPSSFHNTSIIVQLCNCGWEIGKTDRVCQILMSKQLSPPLVSLLRQFMSQPHIQSQEVKTLLVYYLDTIPEDFVFYLYSNPQFHSTLQSTMVRSPEIIVKPLLELEPPLDFIENMIKYYPLPDKFQKAIRQYKEKLEQISVNPSNPRDTIQKLLQNNFLITLIRTSRDLNLWELIYEHNSKNFSQLIQLGLQKNAFHAFNCDQLSMFFRSLIDIDKNLLVQVLDSLLFSDLFPFKANKYNQFNIQPLVLNFLNIFLLNFDFFQFLFF